MTLPALRLVLAVSLDGRLAPPAGGAAQLGGPGDRQALEEALAWADGGLIGAGTLRLHGTTCLIHQPALLQQRALTGRPPQPVAVVVSRSGRFNPSLPFFSQPLERWLLQSEAAAELPDPSAGATGQRFHQTLPLQDWRLCLAGLKQRGLKRLVVLGGAQLAAAVLEEELVEELQLTLCPLLLGGPHTWLGPMVSITSGGWKLVERRDLERSELLLRYRRH